jgi:hypothetical protein
MKIDDRSLNVCNVITYGLHSAEEGFDNNQSAAWHHCASTVFQDSYAVFIIPVMVSQHICGSLQLLTPSCWISMGMVARTRATRVSKFVRRSRADFKLARSFSARCACSDCLFQRGGMIWSARAQSLPQVAPSHEAPDRQLPYFLNHACMVCQASLAASGR